MELPETFQGQAKALISAIQAELASRNLTVHVDPRETYEDPRLFILTGTAAGAQISVKITEQLNKLAINWGPYYVDKRGLAFVSFSAYTYKNLLSRLHKEIAKIGACPVGDKAVEAWFDWVHSTPAVQANFVSYAGILKGEIKEFTIAEGLQVKVPQSILEKAGNKPGG